jgi:hypothetical protein
LFIGTIAENNADKKAKGRQARGEMSNMSDFIEQDVMRIRSLYVCGSRRYGTRALGREYKVDQKTISKIVNRKTWAHI